MQPNVQNLHAAGSRTGFGRVVGDARRARKLTQEEAANLLGMSRRTLIDIEADRIEPKRFEKAGILAVLNDHYEATLTSQAQAIAARRTWRRVLLGAPSNPRVWIDLEEEKGQWWSALGYDAGRHGGLEPFKGPYSSREAAERNAAAFGCDMMRARKAIVFEHIVRKFFGLQRAKSAP